MILTTNKKAEVLTSGIEETINMTIDDSDKAVLMMILSEGLYSSPISSSVREASSNAKDSHIEAGIDEPIIVSLVKNSEGLYEFSVEDVGTGISPERMDKIVSRYAASTKRNDSKQLGAFGLGFKVFLSWRDNFIIISRFDGIEYTYTMYKGEDGTKIALLNERETIERNGVKIIAPLKNNSDFSIFRDAIKEQLAYFENVYFNIVDNWSRKCVSNDFKIIKSEHWKYSELAETSLMHLCLDNVYYPIDFEKLGIDPIYFPVGLNFSVSDGIITPTPNRESIIMTPTVKEKIMEKIRLVATYFVEKYNETIKDRENLLDIWEDLAPYADKEVTIGSEEISIKPLAGYSDTPIATPSIKGIEKVNLERLYTNADRIFHYYSVTSEIHQGRFRKDSEHKHNIFSNLTRSNVILYKGSISDVSKVKIEYIKSLYRGALFVKKNDIERPLKVKGNYNSYYNLLGLNNYPKNEWRQVIQEYQSIEKGLVDRFENVEDIEPTTEWLEERKANRKKGTAIKIEKQEIHPKYAVEAKTGTYSCKYEGGTTVDTAQLPTDKLYVYALQESREKLDQLYDIAQVCGGYYGKQVYPKLNTVILVPRDVKRLENVNNKNWISLETFMEGKHELFGKYCTQIAVKLLIEENSTIFKNINFIKQVNEEFGNTLKHLNEYQQELRISQPNELLKEMLEICEKGNCWDSENYNLYLETKSTLTNWDFINFLKHDRYGYTIDKEALTLAKEIYSIRKQQKQENQ